LQGLDQYDSPAGPETGSQQSVRRSRNDPRHGSRLLVGGEGFSPLETRGHSRRGHPHRLWPATGRIISPLRHHSQGVRMPPKEQTSIASAEIPLERDLFLRALIRELSGTLQDVVGLEDAAGFVSVVGQRMGEQLNSDYRQ